MLKQKTPDIDSLNTSSSLELLIALNQVAASLQRSARSETDVLHVFSEQIGKLGLWGGLSLLDEGDQRVVIRAFASHGSFLRNLEKLTGLKIEGYSFPLNQVRVYQQVVESKTPIYLVASNEVIHQILPKAAQRFTKQLVDALGAIPAIYSPLVSGDKTIGVLNVVGAKLTPNDLPAIEAFSNQIAIALESAYLFAAMQKEVDERMLTDGALLESEAKFRALTENAASAIFIYQGTDFQYVNRAMEEISGYTRQELLGMKFWEVVHPKQRELVKQRGLARQKGEAIAPRYEIKILRKDGQTRWVDFSAVSIEYQGKPAALGTAFDITERKQAEQALEASEQKYRNIVQQSTDGFVLVDEQGKITEWNPGMEQISGVEQNQALGRHIWDVQFELGTEKTKTPERYTELKNNIKSFLATGQAPWINQIGERKIIRKDGEERDIQVMMYPIPTDAGCMVGSIIRDVSEHNKLEYIAHRRTEDLREAMEQRAAELEAIRQASLGLTSSLDLPEVLNAILKSVFDLLPDITNGHIFLYDPNNDGSLTFGAALWANGFQQKPWSNPRSNGLTYSVARSGEAVLVPDMQTHPIYQDAPPDWSGAIIGLPLKIGSSVVGVMNVSYEHPRQFDIAELRVLSLLGSHAAIAIDNARLYEQAETERGHLRLLHDIARELSSSMDPVEILDRAISATCQALGGQVGQAFLYSEAENRLRLQALYGLTDVNLDEFNSKVILRAGDGLAGWVLEHRKPVYVQDVLQDQRWLHVSGVDDKVRSAIVAPVISGNRSLGVLSVFQVHPAAFTADQLDMLLTICQEVGLALSNARRYQEVDRRLKEMTLIQDLAQTFSHRLQVQELLDEVVEQLVRKLGYNQVEIFLVEGDSLVQRSLYGTECLEQPIPLIKGVIGRVTRSGEAALVHDVKLDPDYLPMSTETVAELAVPILNGKVVIGVINVESFEPDQLTIQDRDLLNLLAGQVSIALENAVLYERVRQHAGELEILVAQKTAELAELFELSQEIAYTVSYDDLLTILLNHLRNAMDCDLVIGGLFLEGFNRIAMDTCCSVSPELLESLHQSCMKALRKHKDVAKTAQHLPIDVISHKENKEGDDPLSYINSMLTTMIFISKDVVGFLVAGNERKQAFGQEDKRLLDTFANQAGSAVQRLISVMAAEQRRLEGLVEHLPTGVLLLDADYRLLVANPLAKEILVALNGKATDTQPLSRLGSLNIVNLIKKHNDPVPVDIYVDDPYHRVFEAQARLVERESHHWVVTLRDVTKERETQTRIQMQDRLATVGQLAAGIAHDFNNIMAAILVYTDLLVEEIQLPEVGRERLTVIQQQVQRAASLIRQILDFSRRSVMEQSTLDLLPFTKELDRMLTRVLPETIELKLSYHSGSYLVHADPTRLQQVFMNLAVNARDAMPDGGVLHFELGKVDKIPDDIKAFPELVEGDWIYIAVKDTGVGISPESLPHVFEPFFTTKPVGQGTGLGLAQAYGIIKQHDGYIDVESQVGQGTTFTIYLPALCEPNTDMLAEELSKKLEGDGAGVLVVEDDQATLTALQVLLENHNYHVVTAHNGVEAMQVLNGRHDLLALVVSDVVMPQMGGVALYRTIRESWPEIKMLFVTGHPLEGESQDLLERGDVHWLQKPFSVSEFSRKVQAVLDGA